MPAAPSPPPVPLPAAARRRALAGGAVGLLVALAWFFVLGYLGNLVDPEGRQVREWWHRGLFGALGLIGVAATAFGLWRLGAAKDRRYDLLGWTAMLLTGLGLLVLVLWIFFTFLIFSPGPIFGG